MDRLYEQAKEDKPNHYQSEKGIDIIDLCEAYNLSFLRGNIIKYVARAGRKGDTLEDLNKALNCLKREIAKYE